MTADCEIAPNRTQALHVAPNALPFDRDRLAAYVRAIKTDRPNLAAIVPDAEIPAKMGLEKDAHPSYTMHYLVRPLLEAKKLAMTNPSMPKDPAQRFIRT